MFHLFNQELGPAVLQTIASARYYISFPRVASFSIPVLLWAIVQRSECSGHQNGLQWLLGGGGQPLIVALCPDLPARTDENHEDLGTSVVRSEI
jgi:hypothetical protein